MATETNFRTLSGAERDWQPGQPTPDDKYHERFLKRFWAKVDKTPGLGPWGNCWEWRGSTVDRKDGGPGYGQIGYRETDDKLTHPIRAHVASYTLVHGHPSPPRGWHVCHKCNNKPCVRDEHLFPGTPKQNVRHAMATGLMPVAKPKPDRYGERYAATFSPSQRKTLRTSRKLSRFSFAELSRMLEIDQSHLSKLETGHNKGRGLRVDKLICLLKMLDIDSIAFDLASIPLTWAMATRPNAKFRTKIINPSRRKRGRPKGVVTNRTLSDLVDAARRILEPSAK